MTVNMGFVFRVVGNPILRFGSWLKNTALALYDLINLSDYLHSDRRPWRTGYGVYRARYLAQITHDESMLEIFRKSESLPDRYGYRLDARMVEIPWALSHLAIREGRLLDAGSSLNSTAVLDSPALAPYKITIATLAPESACYWQMGVSYTYGDLRQLDFRDGWFDAVICISTIEHVGMDNTRYAASTRAAQAGSSMDFVVAVKELKRVLKMGGALLITFPFGEYEDHGWFQQFDSARVNTLIDSFRPMRVSEAVFRYEPDGWKLSNRAACTHCRFFDVRTSKYFDHSSTIGYPADFAAGERAVMCLELIK